MVDDLYVKIFADGAGVDAIRSLEVGCHIITVKRDLLGKLDLLGKNLTQYSPETVQMLRRDALAAGFML